MSKANFIMRIIFSFIAMFLLGGIFFISCQESPSPKWENLLAQGNLDDWTIKISKHELDENHAHTFEIENGVLKIDYEAYGEFDQQYGHIFYKRPFSAYLLKLEYRFLGEQATGGEEWAYRNSGVMLHCQAPNTMLKDQDFPISIEGQLLGGDGLAPRSTGNLCTPGTTVYVRDSIFTPHCVNSSSKTYHGDQWVEARFLVLKDSIIKHIIQKDTVMVYTKPQIGGENVKNFDPRVKIDGQPLSSGYISLQSESHPVEFRNVQICDLVPFYDNKKLLRQVLKKIAQE